MAEARRAGRAAADGEPCVFCGIVAGDTPAEVVYRDAVATAFLDRSPLFPGHTLVVPTRHVLTLPQLRDDEIGPFFTRVRSVAALVPEVLGAQGTFVANNNVVSQSVAHLHVHVVPRTKGDGLRGFFWPRRRYADGEMAEIGDRLRRAFASIELDDGR
jgi:histidine triad (HIT) family protein